MRNAFQAPSLTGLGEAACCAVSPRLLPLMRPYLTFCNVLSDTESEGGARIARPSPAKRDVKAAAYQGVTGQSVRESSA